MADLTEIERLRIDTQNQVNYMVSKFQEAIRLHNENQVIVAKNVADYKVLDETVKEHVAYVKSFLCKFDEHKANFDHLSHMFDVNKSDVENKRFDSQKKFDSLAASNAVFIQELGRNSDKTQSLDKRLDFLSQLVSSLNDQVKGLEDLLSNLNKKDDEFSAKLDRQEKEITELKLNISMIGQQLIQAASNNSQVLGKFESILNLINSNQNSSVKFFNDCIQIFRDDVDNKFSSLQIPSIQGLAKVDELKKFQHQLDGSSLDAKNAFLKVSNCDMQILLMNKKIESLAIAQKNFELTQ